MQNNLVISLIGADRPGLVGELSTVIAAHQASWQESSMSHLAGQFAGILRVQVSAEQTGSLQTALQQLTGLQVTAVLAKAPVSTALPARNMQLSLVGHDRIGIIREITQALAQHGVNVSQLSSHLETAAMSAENLFHASAHLQLPDGLDAECLVAELEKISDDLMVELTVDAA